MTDANAHIDALLARMREPYPDDDPRDHVAPDRDDWPGTRIADMRADEAADRYERELDRRWE